MSASAPVRQVVRLQLAEPGFPAADFRANDALRATSVEVAGKVKRIMKQAGLSIKQISALTEMRFGMNTPCFIPPTFLFKIKTGVSPHICQLVALSELTGRPFTDWMRLFGFDVSLVHALQFRIDADRREPCLAVQTDQLSPSRLIRVSRSRTGLTLRKAHDLSVQIAELLRDRNYAIAVGQLSDYEAMDKLPRHIAKVMSLCIIYAIDIRELIKSAGIRNRNRMAAQTEHIAFHGRLSA